MARSIPNSPAEKVERFSTFSARVTFACCPTERVKHLCGSGPIVEKDANAKSKSKRRSSGLNLASLRPKSSHGRARDGPVPQQNNPCTPRGSALPPPPNSSSSTSSAAPWWPLQTTPQVLEWAGNAEDRWGEAWEILPKPSGYSQSSTPSSSHDRSAAHGRENKFAGAIEWRTGQIDLVTVVVGGDRCHEIVIHHDDRTQGSVHIATFPSTSGPKRQQDTQVVSTGIWDASDVHLVHDSVFHRAHILSLRTLGQKLPSSHSATHSPPSSPSTNARRVKARTTTTNGLSGVFGFRPRGRTFSGHNTPVHDRSESSIESRLESAESSQPSSAVATPTSASIAPSIIEQLSLEPAADRTIFLCFETDAERQDWFAVFRSFCRHRTPDEPTCHRRLSISAFDLVETAPVNPKKKVEHDGDKTTDVWSRMSRGETYGTTGYVNDSIITKRARSLKEGWSEKDRLCLQVLLDGMVLGSTSWTKATEKGTPPFWGETLSFSNLGSFSTCVLNLYRQSKGRAVHIATVNLPLVSDFARSRDERYPVRSVADDTVVGELRLSVSFQEVETFSLQRYNAVELASPEQMDVLYHLESRNQLDGLYDTLAKVGLATGKVLPLLSAMSDREAQASDRTLFRGNTPLSRLLESTLRMLCHDFLIRSIGPTICRLAETPDGTGKVLREGGQADTNEVERVWSLVEACWTDIYAARASMPETARSCLAFLFASVKSHHPESAEVHLPFKAISSFVFLRLLNPAIMRPHLFGLRSGLLLPGPRKTATLLARVMSSMSFFTPKEAPRDPELALFADLIRVNSDMMLDYLSTFATQPDQTQESLTSPAAAFVRDRTNALPRVQAEAVPNMTVAGPIDLQAEAAVLSATLHQRRSTAYIRTDADNLPAGLLNKLRDLDENLNAVHGSQLAPPQPRFGTPPHLRRQHESRFARPAPLPPLPLPTTPSAARPSADGSQSPTLPVYHMPPHPDEINKKGAVSHREMAGALIRRSLSGKGLRRRGSMPGMRILPAGREVDDLDRPKTARR